MTPAQTSAALLALSLVPGLSCVGQECTLVGYICGLSVLLEGEAFVATGTWEVEVQADSQRYTCTYIRHEAGETLDTAGSAESIPSCEGRGDVYLTVEAEAAPEWDPVFFMRVTRHPPSRVEVAVFHEGTLLAEESFTPTFKTTEPNGPGCGECTNARVRMTIPAPS